MLFFRIFELQTFRQIQDVTTEVATSSLRFKLHHGRIPYLEPQATAEDCIGKIQKNGHKQRKPLYKWGDPTSIHEFCCFMFLFWSTLSESKKDSNASDLKICTERCKAAKWRRKTRYHWLRGVEMTSSKTYQVLAIPLCPMLPCVPQFKAIGSGNLPTANFHKSLVPWNARQIRLPRVSLGYHTYISCDWRCPKYELQLPTRLWIGIPNSCQDAALCLVFLKQFPSMGESSVSIGQRYFIGKLQPDSSEGWNRKARRTWPLILVASGCLCFVRFYRCASAVFDAIICSLMLVCFPTFVSSFLLKNQAAEA